MQQHKQDEEMKKVDRITALWTRR